MSSGSLDSNGSFMSFALNTHTQKSLSKNPHTWKAFANEWEKNFTAEEK